MKQYSRFITVIGGILAFFSFALPWESDLSGAQLANGGGTLITILLVVALAFIGVSIYMLNRYTSWNSRINLKWYWTFFISSFL